MNNLINVKLTDEGRITSVELVGIINTFREMEKGDKYIKLRHNDFMTKIRKELEVLKVLGLEGERNISQSSYINSQNKTQPCYSLNKDGMLQMLNSESALVRFKTIEYINKLEKQLQQLNTPSYMIEDPIKRAERWIEEQKEKLRIEEENKTLTKEINHKEDIIIGLVDNIDLATKRQRITQIIRHNANGKFKERYNLLYGEFERKYHIDLSRRIESCDIKPKIKNKMDYIDRGLNKIPELYEIACKLFENDVKELIKEWESII